MSFVTRSTLNSSDCILQGKTQEFACIFQTHESEARGERLFFPFFSLCITLVSHFADLHRCHNVHSHPHFSPSRLSLYTHQQSRCMFKPFYLLNIPSNRQQEWVDRPTATASFWPAPHDSVLGGRDLQRSVHGTWLGVTKQGRIACLTNYHENDEKVVVGAQSRGAIVNGWLKSEGGSDETADEFAKRLLENGELKGTGGFILMYGRLQDVVAGRKPGFDGDESAGQTGQTSNGVHDAQLKGLSVLSNRMTVGSALPHLITKPGETIAVSNAPFGDRSWPKVPDAETQLSDAVSASVNAKESKEELIERLIGVLNSDKMPEWDGKEDWKKYTRKMEGSVFLRKIPLHGPQSTAIGGEGIATPLRRDSPNPSKISDGTPAGSGTATPKGQRGYGTTKQTVITVDKEGELTYVERTLWDEKERWLSNDERDRVFSFKIEGW